MAASWLELGLVWLLRGVWCGIGVLPRGLFGPLAAVLAPLRSWTAPRERRQLAANIQAVYGLPPRSYFARLFARQVFRQQLVIALESLRAIRNPDVVAITGFPELSAIIKTAEAAGRGHIMITAHLGSWELCAYYAQKAAERALHVLAKPAKRHFLTLFLAKVRARMGSNVLWTDKKTLLREMLGALKQKQSLGFVMDQKPEGRKGPQVPFFGLPTEFVSGPAAMAIRADCPVIAIFCLREGPFRYRLVSEEVLPAGHGATDELALTAMFAAVIENMVRAYPEQWTWSYKRWRQIKA